MRLFAAALLALVTACSGSGACMDDASCGAGEVCIFHHGRAACAQRCTAQQDCSLVQVCATCLASGACPSCKVCAGPACIAR